MTGTIQQFDYGANVLQTLLWQYENAPNIEALLQAKQDKWDVDFTQFWQDFQTNIFNLKTANAFGLGLWAIILGQPISFHLTTSGDEAWGVDTNRFNFDNGNFQPQGGSVYNLSAATSRVVLQLRYYQLTGTCTVPAINRALKDIFYSGGYGTAYVIDNHDMTQHYVFNFTPPSDMQLAFNNFDILPRPAGVGSSWSVYVEGPWGFNSDAENFSHGNFTAD